MRMTFSMPMRLTLAACVVVFACTGCLPAGAQLTGQNKPVGSADQAATIKVTSRLIIEAVGVKDKKGNPIEGLSAKDFTITEDGVAQTIKICEHNVLTEDATPLGVTPAGEENVKIYNRLARTQIAPEATGEIRGGPVSRAGGRAEVHSDADDGGRPRRYFALLRKLGRYTAGLQRRPKPSVEHSADDGGGRRTGGRGGRER